MKFRKIATAALTAVSIMGMATQAAAEFPKKPITMFIGFAAGGGTDLQGRSLAKGLQKELGVPINVVNKTGASSMLAAAEVAKANADGHVVWFGSMGTMILANTLGKTELDFFTDFKLAGITGELIPSITVPHNSPYKTVQDLIDDAKANPGKLRWAHGGTGTAFYASGVGFAVANGLDVVDVPSTGRNFRGLIVAEQVDYGVSDAGDSITPKWDGKLRVLAVIRDNRLGILDDSLPTLGELGLPFTAVRSPVGVLVPAGVPDDVVTKLSAAIKKVSESDEFKETLLKRNKAALFISPADGVALGEKMRDELNDILPQLTAN